MICCSVTLTTFANESATTVPYIGNKPTVTLSYLIDGVWQAMGVATVVQITDTDVTVTHGGASTGVIKIVQ